MYIEFYISGEVILYNVFYEIFTFCTSIVAEDSNGELMETSLSILNKELR